MIAWMLYCTVVSAVVVGAARSAESLARLSGYRLRWIWCGALALAVFLSVSSGVARFERPAPLSVVATTRGDVASATTTAPTWTEVLRSAASEVERVIDGSLVLTSRAIDRAVSPSATTYAVAIWMVGSLGLAALFAIVIYQFSRARRQWPTGRVQDVPVRISPNVGPIVVGLVRPEIVVPRWLLHRALGEQRLAVAHEQEHLRARDPMLLGVAWLVVVLAPWNPAAWYMLARLRLAIELDCDARVLRRGAAPRAYGSLLIEVAQNAAPLTLSALGFADESSQLYQRILALREPVASFARTRALAAGLIAAAGVLVACRIAPPPVSPASPASPVPTAAAPEMPVGVHEAPPLSPATNAPLPETTVVRPMASRATPRPARHCPVPSRSSSAIPRCRFTPRRRSRVPWFR